MKKLLTLFLVALLASSVGWAETVIDVLDRSVTGITGTTYTEFSGKTVTSSAVYAGACAGGNTSIQLRSSGTPASGIVTTTSGGKVKKVTVVWNSNTASGRKLDIYCKNTAYTGAGNLYASANQGTKVGSIEYGTSTSFTISGDYEYIGLRSNNGAMYLTSITIEWEVGGSTVETCATPVFSPAAGTYTQAQSVTISTTTEGASIRYTTDGSTPASNNGELYKDPINVSETTTIKAIAYKVDCNDSGVAEATYTFPSSVSSIAEALTQTGQFVFNGDATVVYQNGSYLYIKDGSGYGLIYGSGVGSYTNGQILNQGWVASKTTYNGLPEFNDPVVTTFGSSSSGSPVEPVELTTLTDADLNKYATMSNITITGSSNGNYNFEVNGTVYQLRNQIGVTGLPDFTEGKTYNVRGFGGIYQTSSKTTYQFYPIWAEEVVSADPTIEADPTELVITDATTGTLNVTGSNISGNISSSLTGSNNEGWSLSTQSLAADGGDLNVYYNARFLSAENNVKLSADGADDVNVPVTYRPNLYIVGDYGDGNDWNFATGTPMTYNESDDTYTATITTIENTNAFLLISKMVGDGAGWSNEQFLYGPVCDYSGNSNNNQNWELVENNLGGTHNLDLTNGVHHCIYIPAAKSGTYTITVNPPYSFTITREVVLTGDFTLVTDASQLAAGNQVIIVNKGVAASDARTLGQRNDNNYYGTGVIVSNAKTVTATDATQIFTLESGTGGWYFKTSDNLYLSSYHTGTGNYLQTKEKDKNGENTSLATIAINTDNSNAEIHFQGAGSRKYLRYNVNNGSANDIFSCYQYSTSQAPVFIYQRGPSTEPSISVNPSSLDLVIPAGESTVNGTVTVTETNVTGSTTVTIDGDAASDFGATLNNGTLTVTYSGNAPADAPAEVTITLTNGTATATVTVTGYKVPLTVTISPTDGATFSENSMNGTIEANNENATIYYKTNEMDEFEEYSGSFTVTNDETDDPWVQAYAVCGDETSATVTATYHHVSLSETIFTLVTSTDQLVAGNKYIIVYDRENNPLALHDNGYAAPVDWSGDNINIAGTSTTVFTLGENGDAYTLFCNNGYLTHSVRNTTYTDNVNSLSILADDEWGYYVMEGSYYLIYNIQVSENSDPFRWYNSLQSNQPFPHLYVQGVEDQPTPATLAEIEQRGKLGKVTVSDQLIGAWAVNNGTRKLLWAKDQGDASIDKRPARTDTQDDYVVNRLKYQKSPWDESNWVVLDFSGLEDDPMTYVGHKLKPSSVTGTYSDAVNYTITLSEAPQMESENRQDAIDYPGYDGDNKGQHDADNYGTKYRWAYNTYMPANFMPENLNRIEDGQVVGAHSGENALANMQNQELYFMNPKVMEVAHIWGVWCGEGSDKFSIYTTAMENGQTVNAWDIHGAVDVLSWMYNNKGGNPGVYEYGEPYGLGQTYAAQDFHAVIVRKPASNSFKAGINNDASSDLYGIYPLDLPDGGQPTAVRELGANKQVESVRYYNIMGIESKQPFDGVNIIVTRYTDGSTSTIKVLN